VFGNVVMGATYSNIRYSNIAALGQSSADFNDAELSVQYPFTPQWSVGAAYNFLKGNAVTLSGRSQPRKRCGIVTVLACCRKMQRRLRYETNCSPSGTFPSEIYCVDIAIGAWEDGQLAPLLGPGHAAQKTERSGSVTVNRARC
jgi:hypothetical protein